MKNLTAGLALVTLSTLACAAGTSGRLQPLDFKGLVVGSATEQASVERALGIKCDSDGAGQRTICNGVSTIVDSLAQVNIVIGPDGVLDRISITVDSGAFDSVAEGFTRKFGRASHASHPIVQNGFGANFRQDEREWLGSNGTQLVIEKFAGSTDSSSVYFSTLRDRKLLNSIGNSSDL